MNSIDLSNVPADMLDEVKAALRKEALEIRLSKTSKIQKKKRLIKRRNDKIKKFFSYLSLCFSTGNFGVDLGLNAIILLSKIDKAMSRKITENMKIKRQKEAERIKDWRERGLFTEKGYWENLKEIQAHYQSKG